MKAPTLIDAFYRMTFRPTPIPGWRSNGDMRRALEGARRFVIDEPMAAFMAELANEVFIKHVGTTLTASNTYRKVESLRVSARLPHEAVWIEYPLRSYQVRAHELLGKPAPVLSELPVMEGWLIQQHPKIESACIMHLFTEIDQPSDGFSHFTFPLAFAWVSDDNPLPWRRTVKEAIDGDDGKRHYSTEALSGVHGYYRENVGYVRSPLVEDPLRTDSEAISGLMVEWAGVLRRVWALLATLDHLPLTFGQVRQSKGFLARGRIRKYLSHNTITLNVPGKVDTRVIARKAIAAAHRKRHEVRGHWRDDWRNPPSKHCNPHLWANLDENADVIRCDTCGGRQFYIHKHERGDAALGYVTHSYLVKHQEPK
jgi:hypothetical protein